MDGNGWQRMTLGDANRMESMFASQGQRSELFSFSMCYGPQIGAVTEGSGVGHKHIKRKVAALSPFHCLGINTQGSKGH